MTDHTTITPSIARDILGDLITSEVETEFKLLVNAKVAVADQVETVDVLAFLLW